MADFIALWQSERSTVAPDYHDAVAAAEEMRDSERQAAIVIQSLFRGHMARMEMRRLVNAVLLVQRNAHRVLDKIARRKFVIETLRSNRQAEFHRAATMFQALWKGFYTRKNVHDFYDRQSYLRAIQEQSTAVKADLQDYHDRETARIERAREAERARRHAIKVNREHHLLGTTMIQGVYHKDKGPVSESELRESVRDLHLTRKPAMHLTRFGQPLEQWSGFSPGKSQPLPKIQGPFKSPEKVAVIKNRQPMLSLRAESDFFAGRKAHLAEQQRDWLAQVQPAGFSPCSTKSRALNGYQKELVNQTGFADALDHRVRQSVCPTRGDLSCRIPTKTVRETVTTRFDATVLGVTAFDEVQY